jgi:hypothetical protein
MSSPEQKKRLRLRSASGISINEYINLHPTDFRWHEVVYNVAMCYETMRDYGKAYEMYKIYSDAYALRYPGLKLPQTVKLKLREYGKDED